MNSGKSTALMQAAHNYEERGMRVLVLKPKVDTRGGGRIVSRLGVSRTADLLITPEMDLLAEIQLMAVTVELEVPVLAYGLRADFATRGFEGSTRLLELAHTIEEMKTICACGRKAVFNARRVNGEYVFEGDQIVIDEGDAVEYESLCASCYYAARSKALRKDS